MNNTGRITKAESRLVPTWIPIRLVICLKSASRKLDTDRSKFIRAAIREKLERNGIVIPADECN